MFSSWRLPLAGALLLVPTFCASTALACSAPYCTPAAFSIPEGAVVPANLAELSLFADSPVLTSGERGFRLRLWDASDPARALLTQGVGNRRAALIGLLAPGASYVAEASTCGDGDDSVAVTRTLHFTVAAAASDPPVSLGPLRVARSGRSIVGYGGGTGCFYTLVADAVDLALDESALPPPWRGLLSDYQLMVDGEPLGWLQTIGTGEYGPKDAARGFYFGAPGPFRTFTECDSRDGDTGETPPFERPGLAPGKHTAWVTARVPTSPAKIIESERIEVELACPRQEAETGTDAGVRKDAGPSADAGNDDDPSDDEPDSDDTSSMPADDEEGCALSQHGARRPSWPAHGLLFVALALLRRKRAVQSRQTPRRSTD